MQGIAQYGSSDSENGEEDVAPCPTSAAATLPSAPVTAATTSLPSPLAALPSAASMLEAPQIGHSTANTHPIASVYAEVGVKRGIGMMMGNAAGLETTGAASTVAVAAGGAGAASGGEGDGEESRGARVQRSTKKHKLCRGSARAGGAAGSRLFAPPQLRRPNTVTEDTGRLVTESTRRTYERTQRQSQQQRRPTAQPDAEGIIDANATENSSHRQQNYNG